MKKITSLLVLSMVTLVLLVSLTGCTKEKVIDKNEDKNKEWLSTAYDIMDDRLSIPEDLEFGTTEAQLREDIDEPYIDDYENYISVAKTTKLPVDKSWKNEDGSINPEAFKENEILSYYVTEASEGLYEFGYMAYNVNLNQYDFLKEYYTKKYGKPANEEWIWNDSNYEPTGKEDYYKLFDEGKVKVLTVWDIKDLDTVLTVDWLNDPAKPANNYGQISFYKRSEDFSVEEAIANDTTSGNSSNSSSDKSKSDSKEGQ